MSKLPSQSVTIRDLTSFTRMDNTFTGVPIAAIINSKTGKFERTRLNNFDDLLTYYCTGSAITQKDDVTIQCIGALLNYTPVDVIRVGSSKLKIGKTDNGQIIYTKEDDSPINKLYRLSFFDKTERENSLAISTDEYTLYVGDRPTGSFVSTLYDDNKTREPSIKNLVKFVVEKVNFNILNYNDNQFFYEQGDQIINFYDTYSVDAAVSYINANTKVYIEEEKKTPINSVLIVNDTSYVFNGNGENSNLQIYDEPYKVIQWFNNNGDNDDFKMTNKKFLSLVVSYMPPEDLVTYKVICDFSSIEVLSDNLTNRLNVNNKEFIYSKEESYDSLYFIKDDTIYQYNECELPEEYLSKIITEDTEEDLREVAEDRLQSDAEINLNEESIGYKLVKITNTETDLLRIINLFEREVEEELIEVKEAAIYLSNSSVFYSVDDVISSMDIDGLYRCTLKETEFQKLDNYHVGINGTVYYCGNDPEWVDGDKEHTPLSEDILSYNEFLEKLFTQLNADRILGFVNHNTILLCEDSDDKININCSNNINILKSVINQEENISKAKFALIAQFPTTLPLFSYSFKRNESIEDYDIIDITWSYNQSTGTMSVGFDENCCNDYGDSLYYTKYNEGETENDFFHIIQLNDFKKWDDNDNEGKETKVISAFGDELTLPTPTAIDYANAILKFKDYEDVQYSFIWDSGYASPIVAKAMNQLAVSKNSQFIPSYPLNYKDADQFKAYHDSLGLDTNEGYEVIPAFKGQFCGSFLTTVPAGLAYMVSRVNAYNNHTIEFQPTFGPIRGAVNAPNLVATLKKEDREYLNEFNINCIVSDINGTYINNNNTAQKRDSYLSSEQNVYMSNVIAHVCEQYNPKIIAEVNDDDLRNNIVNQLTQLIEERVKSGKKPTINAFRVICNKKLNTKDVIESNKVKYKVEVQYIPEVKFVDCYLDVVPLNSF